MIQGRVNDASDADLLRALLERLGGVDGLQEHLFDMKNGIGNTSQGGVALGVDEDSAGYCYLRFFDPIDMADAKRMGPYPTIAEIRRFSNGRSDPFGSRAVTVSIWNGRQGRVAHVAYNSGLKGLRPVQALSALARDVRVGGLPDGVSEDFPSDWIPAKRAVYQTWDYTMGLGKRNLNILDWLGPDPLPDSDSKLYEPISSTYSRVKWVVRASPVGPSTAKVDVIDNDGLVKTVKYWESLVGPWGHYQNYLVRGEKVFVEAHVWRPARVTTTPGAPAPTPPTRDKDRDELFASRLGARKNGLEVHVVDCSVEHKGFGTCYMRMFKEDYKERARVLGKFPTVTDILAFLMAVHVKDEVSGEDMICDNLSIVKSGVGLYHVEDGEMEAGAFLEVLFDLPRLARVGATQGEAVKLNEFENVALPASLTLRPKNAGMVINVPFAVKLSMDKPQLYWDLTAGKKLGSLTAYFESVELVSLKLKATVHKGDADTLLNVAVDTANQPFKTEMDWVAASHTMHVSGNVNGATTGELILEGNHGFGSQLQGLSVGNATPIVQAYLETAVVANALIKAVLTVRVSGTGNPTAIILPARDATLSRGARLGDESDDDDAPALANHSLKRR